MFQNFASGCGGEGSVPGELLLSSKFSHIDATAQQEIGWQAAGTSAADDGERFSSIRMGYKARYI